MFINGSVRAWKRALVVKDDAALGVGTEYIQAILKVVEMEKWWNGEVRERSIPQ